MGSQCREAIRHATKVLGLPARSTKKREENKFREDIYYRAKPSERKTQIKDKKRLVH